MNSYLANDELDSELVIGLVCAVGTESGLVIDLLKERLGRAGYSVEVVKVSQDVISQICEVPDNGEDQFERYSSFMDAGNRCRERGEPNSDEGDACKGDDSILALGAATAVSTIRAKKLSELLTQSNDGIESNDRCESGERVPLPKMAYIIDSLKRPEEVEKLRIIYPSGFILVGVHAEEARRRKHLTQNKGMSEDQAQKLLKRDSDETGKAHGQRVNDTFHLADFFLHITNSHDQLRADVQRLVELWFGNPFVTPTFDEYAMFMAFSSALRSADLSRQVGAVIAKERQILATGANDCPKAGGGLYWPIRNEESCAIEDEQNGRDCMREDGDSNKAEQLKIIQQILEDTKKTDGETDVELLRSILLASGIRDLTEFGRVVHAEMEALLSCARNGISTVGATLFSTTFPCHNCAKHIVAAGVKRVVYVEPYPKSKALPFHNDSIVPVGESGPNNEKSVVFEPFAGVGPRRFFDLFSMNLGSSYPLRRKIKETGRKKEWHIDKAQLRIQMKPISYLELELAASNLFADKVNRADTMETNND